MRPDVPKPSVGQQWVRQGTPTPRNTTVRLAVRDCAIGIPAPNQAGRNGRFFLKVGFQPAEHRGPPRLSRSTPSPIHGVIHNVESVIKVRMQLAQPLRSFPRIGSVHSELVTFLGSEQQWTRIVEIVVGLRWWNCWW